ncbi:hypothetical protein C8R44DRAFT_874662 [Mycena epipterygia]|nr:hypothetical protein C8R44DRAFT_874662 [Mycena epipterygia]
MCSRPDRGGLSTRLLASQPITYKDDYQQPPQNSLKKVPVLHVHFAPCTASQDPGSFPVPTGTIPQVKARLAAKPNRPPAASQRLLLKGKVLADAKLVKEHPVSDGDTVNLVLKLMPADTPPTLTLDPSPKLSPSPGPAPTAPRRHQRIPSVVLSPSPSSETPGATADITLTLDNSLSALPELSAYHVAIADPEFWQDLLVFLRTKFPTDADAQLAFEDFIARIRDRVGIVGMAGT